MTDRVLNASAFNTSSHPVILCSKLTIETLEQGVQYVQN